MDGLRWSISETDGEKTKVLAGFYKYNGWNDIETTSSNGKSRIYNFDWFAIKTLMDYLYFYLGSKIAWGDGAPFFKNIKEHIDVEEFNFDD